MAESKTPKGEGNPFIDFLGTAEGFFAVVLSAIPEAVGGDDDAQLISAHCNALIDQFGKLAGYMNAQYSVANTDLRREVDEFMGAQAVTTLVNNGIAAFRQTAAKGVFGNGVFSWIETIAQEIKKVIAWLSEMFGWPDWISKLLQVLDQILKAILGLFGGALGRSRSKIVSELSAMEVEFWNELAAHKRFALLGDRSEADASD